MLPDDLKERRTTLLRCTLGDESAADFLNQMAEMTRLADDIVDEEEHRQRNVCWLLSRAWTVLPFNLFFQRHGIVLGPLLNSIIVRWQQSDEFRLSGDRLKQTFGFVIREDIGTLTIAVASIIGGYEHAKQVADEMFAMCHATTGETVEDWVKE
ncbi:hypothetical protein [Aliirhizobium cellulosilyticum]|uniref:Uncharacterized protein n=1 Tax=Aliirhizobium cellulosilyticum TaxID=393664 RepID=A0A7W6WPG1_9HYPH|nr:hypothetical protein [Rhizobium cellulosilyticum]MBB4347945.1 hypothetical protein [Rhizobium cellulosilyticum]MBB4409661.1 hypothetical protein [Rhizobium cellulosilyticum]MBB4444348.1 hypothetical protein [Rhizobium cellulosilyticum]